MDLSTAVSRRFRNFYWFLVGPASWILAGCSMGLFSDGKDASVISQKPYREGSALCQGLNIRSNEVDVSQFRELLGCLNSNGSIAEVQKLTDRMSDEELLPLVRVGNEQFFKNANYLYRFQESFNYWLTSGWIGSDLEQIGALVRNDRWLRSLLALMSKADPRLYPALQLIARELDVKTANKGLEALIALVEAPAFKSVQQNLLQPKSHALSTQQLARALLSYIQAQRAPGRVDLDRQVLKALADGSLFRVLDDFSLTLSPGGDIREVVAKFVALSNQLNERESTSLGFGGSNSEKLRELMRLVNGMHAPISCLKGTQVVPDGVMFVLREI